MPTQNINLANIKTVRFNGAEMAEMKLNASSVWVGQTELTISSNTNNYDIGAAVLAAGGDKATNVQLTINPGVTVGSTSTSTAAMYTGTGWSSGTTINIINNGSVVGASGSNVTIDAGSSGSGGTRGRGSTGDYNPPSSGSSGGAGSTSVSSSSNGGDAFEHSQTADNNLSVIFDTAGTRTGGSAGTTTSKGGGGGGGGGSGAGCGIYGGNGGSGGGGSTASGSSGSSSQCDTCVGTYVCGGAGGSGGNTGSNGSTGGKGQEFYYSEGNEWVLTYSGASGGSSGTTRNNSGTAGSALAGNTAQIS